MVAIIGLGFAINSLWTSPAKVLDYATGVDSVSLLQGTNNERIQQGLGALALNNTLSQAAQSKANDMAARNYWSHTTPDGIEPWQFMSSAGYSYALAGENLAYGFATSSDAIAGWMNSPGHRANILKAGYQDVGFGIANAASYQNSGPQTIIVAMYASPAVLAAAPAPAPAAPSTAAPQAAAAPPAQPTTPPPAPEANPTPAPVNDNPKTNMPTGPQPTTTQELKTTPVSRLDVLTQGNAQWAALTITVLIALGAVLLVYRHGRMWHRYLVKGEHFLIKHPLYDIAIVAAIVVSIILSQTSGFIH